MILKTNIITKVTPKALYSMGFELDGFGSPEMRAMYDTRNYLKITEEGWVLNYFPKTFQGIFCHQCRGVDVRGMLVVWDDLKTNPDINFIPIFDLEEIYTIEKQIENGKELEGVKPLDRYFDDLIPRKKRLKKGTGILPNNYR